MKRSALSMPIIGFFFAVVFLGMLALLWLSYPGNQVGSGSADATPTRHVNGSYTGGVALQGAYAGTLNDAATATPLDLGSIDLALDLSQSGSEVTGYIALDHTLVFTREHTIMVTPVGPTPGPGTPAPTPHPLDIGPQVQGSFDDTSLELESEQFSMMLNGQQVTRQFSLESTSVQDNGATIQGEYRETLWGYAPEPSTLVGTFSLQRPVFMSWTPGGPYSIYLPLIRK